MTVPFQDQERFFIITAGRTGSTLLCSLLAGAGADFGMAAGQSWDESRGGTFEHPLVVRAARHFRAAYDLSPQRPANGPKRWRWAIVRHRGKFFLRRALQKVRFVKAVNLDLTVQAAFTQGFFPRIIISYRRFSAQALSLAQMYSHRTIDVLEADYLRTYRNALMQLHLYGGCVVDYDALTDAGDVSWLSCLATLTGTDADRLAAARRPRVRDKASADRSLSPLSRPSEDLYGALCALSGRLLPPSDQALRNWQSRD